MSLCISFVRVKKGLIFQPETIPLNGKSFNLDFHFKQNINMKVRAEENLTGIICRNVLRIRATAFSTKSNPSFRVEDFLSKMIKKFLFFLSRDNCNANFKSFFFCPENILTSACSKLQYSKKGSFCSFMASLLSADFSIQNTAKQIQKKSQDQCIHTYFWRLWHSITAAAYCLQFVAAVQLHSAY